MIQIETMKYLFDLQGYLVIEDVLSADEVVTLNALMDRQELPEPGAAVSEQRFGSSGSDSEGVGLLDWGRPVCDLLDHSRIMPILEFVLGDGFRLDHYYGIYMRSGSEGLRLHGGSTPYDPPEHFHFRDGAMYNGLTVVSWNLRDTGPDVGGLLCIPGSHKSNYACPDEIQSAHEHASCVVVPEVRAGSVVVFSEALAHGTAPWKGTQQRRSFLFKYSPAQQSWSRNYPRPPEGVELSERQKLLFRPPYFNGHPSLFGSEGAVEY
jgi:hypothetical protein